MEEFLHSSSDHALILTAQKVVSAKWVPLNSSCIVWKDAREINIDLKTIPIDGGEYLTVAYVRFVRQPLKILQSGACFDAPVFDFEVIQGQLCAKNRHDCGLTLHSVPSKCRTFRSSEPSFDSTRHKLAFRVTCTTNPKRGHYSSEGMCFYKDGIAISSIFKVVARPGGHAIAKRRETASRILRTKTHEWQSLAAKLNRSKSVADITDIKPPELPSKERIPTSSAPSESNTAFCGTFGNAKFLTKGDRKSDELSDNAKSPANINHEFTNTLSEVQGTPMREVCAEPDDAGSEERDMTGLEQQITRRRSLKRRQCDLSEGGYNEMRHKQPASRPLSMPHVRGIVGDVDMTFDLHQLTFGNSPTDNSPTSNYQVHPHQDTTTDLFLSNNFNNDILAEILRTENNDSRPEAVPWAKAGLNLSATSHQSQHGRLQRRGSYPCLKLETTGSQFKVRNDTAASPISPMDAITEHSSSQQLRQELSMTSELYAPRLCLSNFQNQWPGDHTTHSRGEFNQSYTRRRSYSERDRSPRKISGFFHSNSHSTVQLKPLLSTGASALSASMFQGSEYENYSFNSQKFQIDNMGTATGDGYDTQDRRAGVFTAIPDYEHKGTNSNRGSQNNHTISTQQQYNTAQSAYASHKHDANFGNKNHGLNPTSNESQHTHRNMWNTQATVDLTTSNYDMRTGRSAEAGQQPMQQFGAFMHTGMPAAMNVQTTGLSLPCSKMDLYSRFEHLLKDDPSP
ncbi:hypothetical protein SARC_09943 [Sphaeroforma arctica JP610]|uniref:Uncharacterized protein n=1 Tax=Sphaeroforma arctica JP610 TaxID=667725 RepID=A0A0L0FLE4_9EUKA|nr:hypothetical protein SARC_09943 [Sphaeroforma arctica JP610]KNC77597.1 hypothetical protein SARC_09943 [Sphaeroforma arctica JP610]|eukprot:XP_014151499.1 hypothetical protein SARC_09943 [Sphaeroforma arctica JP610]